MAPVAEVLTRVGGGKGKDLYDTLLPQNVLQVFSNRLSTHNKVHKTEIPGKGELINALTIFIAENVLPDDVETHLVACGEAIYDYLPAAEYEPGLQYRSVIVHRREVTPVEFILRRYLCGSLWKAYQKGEDPYGLELPSGLPLMHRFDEPVLTPTEKSETDEPLPEFIVQQACAPEVALFRRSFLAVEEYLASRGIALLDAKIEFSGTMLIDDWFNGDCTRMTRKSEIREGKEPSFLDKERFRQIAIAKWGDGPQVPLTFTEDEIAAGIAPYYTAFEMITGMTIQEFRRTHFK